MRNINKTKLEFLASIGFLCVGIFGVFILGYVMYIMGNDMLEANAPSKVVALTTIISVFILAFVICCLVMAFYCWYRGYLKPYIRND